MGEIRKFDSGATRDTNTNKPSYIKYLSPVVLKRFGEYMLKHQKQSDGTLRPADNWKKGIPRDAYLDSGFRHYLDLWLHDEGYPEMTIEEFEDSLCAIMFNVMGYLHELLKEKRDNNDK